MSLKRKAFGQFKIGRPTGIVLTEHSLGNHAQPNLDHQTGLIHLHLHN